MLQIVFEGIERIYHICVFTQKKSSVLYSGSRLPQSQRMIKQTQYKSNFLSNILLEYTFKLTKKKDDSNSQCNVLQTT